MFDTGGDGSTLLYNMRELGVNLQEVDMVVLSHIHGDHVGEFTSFLQLNSDVTVYLPISFSQRLKDEVRLSGAEFREVDEARELFEGAFTTGELDGGDKGTVAGNTDSTRAGGDNGLRPSRNNQYGSEG